MTENPRATSATHLSWSNLHNLATCSFNQCSCSLCRGTGVPGNSGIADMGRGRVARVVLKGIWRVPRGFIGSQYVGTWSFWVNCQRLLWLREPYVTIKLISDTRPGIASCYCAEIGKMICLDWFRE